MAAASPEPHRQTARLFLALAPPAPVRATLAQYVAQWHWGPTARRYAPADWHLTLHFLGEVARAKIESMRSSLTVPMRPFTLNFGRAAHWPHGLIVLLPSRVPQALQQLHLKLQNALAGIDLQTETRPYRPHLTLARHAEDAIEPEQTPTFDWQVDGYTLMESTGFAASRYRTLQRYGPAC